MRKTYKYNIKPTPEQERTLDRTLALCCRVYNAAIGERRAAWKMRCVSTTKYQQKAELPGIKEAMPEYAVVNAQVLQDVALRADRVSQAFFQHIRDGATPGCPRFQGIDRLNSFTCPQVGDYGGVRFDNGFLALTNIGRVAVQWSRPIEGTSRTVTISKVADGWYACFSCADAPMQFLPSTGQETVLDLDIEAFATVSNGTRIFCPGWYRRSAWALQTALALVRVDDVSYHADVQTVNMLKHHHRAKRISDSGWSAFLTVLTFNAAYAGKRAVAVPPSYTSQTCAGCGVLVQKGLSVSWRMCPECGTSLHRDHNAARNSERLGQSRRGAVASAAAENRASPGLSRESGKD
jgi:putative transposase